ncbi:MAG: gluconate:H+ symporter, GntP family [Bacillota bacterium]|nr:gluconate:H+ symporter, GntP family [Bacillota bacterium]MDK2925984.1 gluconate:H+ symporter, GntP family [Bacillota bacterium]MDK2960362.1 gluconate:H+ symporter, GntP family [Bacillota bacterium]
MSGTWLVVAFALAIVALIALISKFKLHPSLAILLVVLGLGLAIGLGPKKTLDLTYSGFAGTLKSIGIVIFLGTVMGQILEETGAAVSITKAVIRLVGEKNVDLAIAISAAFLGIAVFADSVVIILIPIVSTIAYYTKRSMAGLGTLLFLAAYITHSLVPPTPGPLAAAAVLKLDLGTSILWGLIVSVPAVIVTWLYCKYLEKKYWVEPKQEYVSAAQRAEEQNAKLPSAFGSFLPILLPVIFITAASLTDSALKGSLVANVMGFIGDPVVSLLLGTFLAMALAGRWDKTVLNDWVEKGIAGSAMPIIVTGLGGSLAALLKDGPLSKELAQMIVNSGLPPILVPFVISAVVCTITGSNTVGVLTGAALMQPMIGSLGLSPLATFLACASGGQWVKIPNSSGFWVTTTLSNMDLPTAMRTITPATVVSGAVSFGFTLLLMALHII